MIRLFLLCSVLFVLQPLSGQWDTIDGLIDFRNDVRSLRHKSTQLPDNFVAHGLLGRDPKIKSTRPVLPLLSVGYNRRATILLGDHVESYILLSWSDRPDHLSLIARSSDDPSMSMTYSEKDVKESGRLMIGPIRGDIDFEVAGDADAPKIQQVYTTTQINEVAMELGFDASFDCHTNINCSEGAALVDVKRSVMRIRMVTDIGIALCTGTLLNNTRGDRTPYVLTAFHCIVPPDDLQLVPLYDMWWFDFNYESASCANPDEEPSVVAVQGAELLSGWEDTDMMLLRITQDIPDQANAYYAGWNRDTTYLADTSYLIHHPQGDIKKISYDYDPATIHDQMTSWNNGASSSAKSHIRNEFDDSTYEQGSSGGAIFDQKGHVLGQLHGGPLNDPMCEIGVGYFGRFGWSWDTGESAMDRLMDWLDPLGMGPKVLDGIDTKQNQLVRISGRVAMPIGQSISDVRVELTGDRVASIVTGSDGRFVFDGLDPSGSYALSFKKDINVNNGLTASDLILIRNHIIGLKVLSAETAIAAADVTQDGALTGSDIVQIRNVIMGLSDRFPASTSWRFAPSRLEVDAGTITSEMNIIVIGVKMGDVNYSAVPSR